MSVEQARLEDTQAWLRKATGDLRAGTLLLLHDPELAERILFFAQQSIEKAFKAFLIAEALKLSREAVSAVLRLLRPAVGQHQLPTLED